MVSKKQPSLLGQCLVNDTYMPTIQQGGIQSRSPTAFQMPLNNMPNRTPIDPDVMFFRSLEMLIKEMNDLKGFGVIWHSLESMTVISESLNDVYIVFSLKDKSKESSSIESELIDLGLNCGGFVIAVVEVKITLAAAPVTWGASLLATGWALTQAAASGLQCSASVYRTYNVFAGKTDINKRLDADSRYTNGMLFLDAVGLVDPVMGGVKIVKSTQTARKIISNPRIVKLTNRVEDGKSVSSRLQKEALDAIEKAGVDVDAIRSVSKSKKLNATRDIVKKYELQLKNGVIRHAVKAINVGGTLSVASSAKGGVVNEIRSLSERAELHLEVIDLSDM